MQTVSENKEFKFEGACPYCKGNITANCSGWTEDNEGNWKADMIETYCSNEPHIDSSDWEDWNYIHSQLPYENWMPLHQRLIKWINERFNFDLS